MTLPTGNPSMELASIAHNAFMEKVPDLFTYANYLMYLMVKNKEEVLGGLAIQQPLAYVEAPNKAWITGTAADTLNLNPAPMLTYATVNWKYFYYALGFELRDFVVTASSKNAIASLMQKKQKQAEGTITRSLTTAMHGTSTSDVNSLNGLQDIFGATGTAYAGLLDTDLGNDANGYPLWLTYRDTTSTNANYTTIAPVLNRLKARAQQQGGGGTTYKLDTMISNSTVQSNFILSQQLQKMFVNKSDLEAGFEGVVVDNVKWSIDEFTPANTLYLITSESIKLCYRYGLGKTSPFDESELVIPNQPVVADRTFFVGNMLCDNRRVNGVFTGLTA